MEILAIERDGEETSAVDREELLAEEARRVWELYQSGVLQEIHFRGDRSAAVLLLECDGPAEAETVLASLPLVRRRHIAFEVIPLRAYPGFARLFRS